MAINRNVMNKAREHASAMDMPGKAQPLVVPDQLRYRTIQCDLATPQLSGKSVTPSYPARAQSDGMV
jgi:hypothetical protein